jgi:transmembrane sensor
MEHLSLFENDPNADKAQRIGALISGYLRGVLTSGEHTELEEWVVESDSNMKVFEDMTDASQLQEGVNWVKKAESAEMLKKLKKQMKFKRPHFRFRFFQYAV